MNDGLPDNVEHIPIIGRADEMNGQRAAAFRNVVESIKQVVKEQEHANVDNPEAQMQQSLSIFRAVLMEHSEGLKNQAATLPEGSPAMTFYTLMDTARALRIAHAYLGRLETKPEAN